MSLTSQQKNKVKFLTTYLEPSYPSFQKKARSACTRVLQHAPVAVTEKTEENIQALIIKLQRDLEMDLDDLRCVFCNDPAKECDHLIPPSQGGTHEISNLAPCCAACNRKKSQKGWRQFLDEMNIDDQERQVRISKLEKYTAGYQPRGSMISSEKRQKIEGILDAAYKLLAQADEVMKEALAEAQQGHHF